APVVAVPDYLGKYRLHGTNLFHCSGNRTSQRQLERRMAMRGALLQEVEKWLRRNGHETRSSDLRAYLTQWKKAQAEDEFALRTPGRWRYFWHLLGYPHTYGKIMTSRHRVYSYMRACAALVLGYHHLYLFDEARKKRKEWMASPPKKAAAALKTEVKAAAATK